MQPAYQPRNLLLVFFFQRPTWHTQFQSQSLVQIHFKLLSYKLYNFSFAFSEFQTHCAKDIMWKMECTLHQNNLWYGRYFFACIKPLHVFLWPSFHTNNTANAMPVTCSAGKIFKYTHTSGERKVFHTYCVHLDVGVSTVCWMTGGTKTECAHSITGSLCKVIVEQGG